MNDAFTIDPKEVRVTRLQRSIYTWARVASEWTSDTGKRHTPAFVTLTYRPEVDWAPKHISRCLRALNEWARRRGDRIPYCWVMELQKRGAPHYHLLLWLPPGCWLPKFDQRGWWPHGMSQIECSNVKNAVAYIAKYVSKGPLASGQADLIPKGARISGRGGLPPGSDQRREARWWALPAWLREKLPLERTQFGTLGTMVRRVLIENDYGRPRKLIQRGKKLRMEPKFRSLRVDETGVVHFSPWTAVFSGGLISVRKKEHVL